MRIGDVYYEKHTVTGISKRTGMVSETNAEIVKVISLDVLDNIRAEISDFEEEVFNRPNTDYSDYAAVRHCLEIIDKYKAEVKPRESEG